MPNIEIYGFGVTAGAVEVCVWDVLKKHSRVNIEDVVVTIISSTVHNHNMRSKPFIRVVSNEVKDESRVALTINRELNYDVEWLCLNNFFEAK